ncbi:MAG TPA: YciI family protein [Pilimelia sp.]|nr:YciI family protein [Pilimelia sp.]
MKYVLMFTDAGPAAWEAAGEARSKEVYEEMFTWFAEHGAAGRIVNAGAELQPVTTATTVRTGEAGTAPVVVDGPFLETKEVIGGFCIVDVPDLDAAVALASTWPGLQVGNTAVEVRPIVDHG